MNRRRAVTVMALLALVVPAAWAAGTRWWVADTPAELLRGKGLGVAVSTAGRLEWTPGWTAEATLEEPVLGAVVERAGSVLVGTGFPARLYRVAGRQAERLAEVPADQVTAMLAGGDGKLYLATVAPAAVFAWDGRRLERVGETGDDGVWALAWFGGGVVAAGGRPAALYRLREQGLERWLELPDTHARSLAVAGDRLLVGTSGKGMVFSVDSRGRRALVADSPFTEIASLAVDRQGAVWAAAVVGEPAAASRPQASGASKKKEGQEGSVTAAAADLELPKVNGTTASSELLRVTPEGALLHVHRFTRQVVSVLAADGDGVLAGTGFEGELWRFTIQGGARLAVLDAAQVTALTPGGTVALTQGPAAVLRRAGHAEGRYRHEPLVLERPAAWGRYTASGLSGTARIRFRSGARKEPDATWSEWSEWSRAAGGEVAAPPGKALQWEVELSPGGSLERVAVAYREINLAPVLESVELLEPGAVILAAPPPTGQYVDVAHPDVNGIFTVLGSRRDRRSSRNGQGGKRYWRVGYRTVRWKASDPNGDALRFRLELEPRGQAPLLVRDRLEETRLAVDTTAVPDGWYRFRVTASDAPSNPEGGAEATAVSRWFRVDNTPPGVRIRREEGRWVIDAEDAGSPIARAEWSRDGKGWHTLEPEDGLLDGLRERFLLPVEQGRHLLVVRVIDAHHNRTTAGTEEE